MIKNYIILNHIFYYLHISYIFCVNKYLFQIRFYILIYFTSIYRYYFKSYFNVYIKYIYILKILYKVTNADIRPGQNSERGQMYPTIQTSNKIDLSN